MDTRRPTPARRRRRALLAAALAVLVAPAALLPPAAATTHPDAVQAAAPAPPAPDARGEDPHPDDGDPDDGDPGAGDSPGAEPGGTGPTGRQWIDRPERVELPEGARNATFRALHCRALNQGRGDRVALRRGVSGDWHDVAVQPLNGSEMCETITWTILSVDRGLGGLWAMVTRQGSVTVDSVTFAMIVRLNPPVVTHPTGGTVRLGQQLTLMSTGQYGTEWPFPTPEWESSQDGQTWTPIPGATENVYRTPPATAEMDGTQYRAVHRRINMNAYESGGMAYSNPATLTVRQEPTIETHPSDAEVPVGGTAEFEAAAVGAPVPTVQWESAPPGGAFTPIPGAVQGRLEVPDVRAGMDGTRYRAVFSSTQGVEATREAVLTVLLPPEFREHPRDVVGLRGQPVSFTAAADGAETWAWQRQPPGSTGEDDWVTYPLLATPTLPLTVGPDTDGMRVRAMATGPGGTSFSDPARVTMLVLPPVQVSVEARTQVARALPGW